RHHAVAHVDAAAGAGHEAAVHPQADDIVLQVHPVENGAHAAGAGRLDEKAAGPLSAAVVVDQRVGNEQLVEAGHRIDESPRKLSLEIPDHAVLDVHGGGLLDLDSSCRRAFPVDGQAAQADNVAGTGLDVDDVGVGAEQQRVARTVIDDADRLADDDGT